MTTSTPSAKKENDTSTATPGETLPELTVSEKYAKLLRKRGVKEVPYPEGIRPHRIQALLQSSKAPK